jgi:universal stress protein A
MPIRTILVPTDFSDSAGAALECANGIAKAFDAKIVLLHVVDLHAQWVPTGVLVVPAPVPGSLVRRTQQQARASLEATAAKIPAVSRTLVRKGHARDVILAVAGEIEADMIVMGTHGRRGVEHLFVGSVAEYVVRNARVPVTTVRGPRRPKVPSRGRRSR